MHRFYRERGLPYLIAFDPLPLCSTQVPEDLASLRSQRCRWRRGLLQSLWRHWRVIGNARYGIVGLGTLPYTLVFEGLGPVLEIAGYLIVFVAAALGAIDWHFFRVAGAVSVFFGAAVTLVAVFLNDVTARRYLRGRDLAMLVAVALLENCGYRQLNAWWACVGTVQALSRRRGWAS